MIQEEVKIEVGQSVDISLESMMGSTGYGWELRSFEGNINMVSMSVQPTSTRAVAPVIQIFSFRGTEEGSGKAVFVLTAPWKVEEPKKQVTYTFNVVKAEDTDIDDNLRFEGFTTPPAAIVRPTRPIALYAVNPPTENDFCNPPQPKYGIQPPHCVGDNCCNQPQPQPKYGIQPPHCIGDDCCNPPVIMKYNVPMMRYNFPPMMRYNFPSR